MQVKWKRGITRRETAIMLTRFKGVGLGELKDAILSVDLNILSYENSHSLYSFAPEKEEVDLVLEYTGDRSLLAKAEQYVLMVSSSSSSFFIIIYYNLLFKVELCGGVLMKEKKDNRNKKI